MAAFELPGVNPDRPGRFDAVIARTILVRADRFVPDVAGISECPNGAIGAMKLKSGFGSGMATGVAPIAWHR